MKRVRGYVAGGSRRTSWTSAALLLGCALALSTFATALVPAGAVHAQAPGAKPSVSELGQELPEWRTRNSRTYLGDNGMLVSRLFAAPVNYRDDRGEWQRIDNGLEPVAAGHVNKANRYRLRLPNDLSGPVRVSEGSAWLEYRLHGASSKAAVTATKALYRDAASGVDVEYGVGGDSVKETLILSGPKSRRSFRFTLRLGPGLAPKSVSNNRIDIVGSDGRVRFSLEAPLMWDSSKEKRSSRKIDLDLARARDGTFTLEVRPDRDWLEDPRREWPVLVDPTVTFPGVERDCYIGGGQHANWAHCADPWLHVGSRQEEVDPYCYEDCETVLTGYRGLLKFDLGGIPSDALVARAKLGLHNDGYSGAATPVAVRAVTRGWTSGVTWNRYDGANSWTTPGGDVETSIAAWNPSVGPAGWSHWYPTGLVQRWISGTTVNHGFLLVGDGDLKFFRSSDYGTRYGDSTKHPYLEVVWARPAPETRIDSGPSGTTDSRDAELAFSSAGGATSFECRLDAGAWAPCASPKRYTALDSRQHSFAVRARNATGETDPTPATRSWLVDHRSPDGQSDQPSISADGRYVAFRSAATDFTAGDSNDRDDIVVYDLPDSGAPQVMERVSVSSAGARADGDSSSPSISADGRYVAFRSSASNLVSGDTNQHEDIFVHDRSTRTTTRVSVSSARAQANSRSYSPSISADGRHVAFSSDASNLTTNDTNAAEDIFVHDRGTGATTRVSVRGSSTQANGVSVSPSISADGRFVAFESWASNLVTGDTNGTSDAFVRDRTQAATTRVSVTPGGAQASGSSSEPSISGDGRRVAFESLSALHASDGNGTSDIYVRDRDAGSTTWVSAGADLSDNGRNYSPSISRNGRYVSFASDAPLHSDDVNGVRDVYEFDLVALGGTQISADDFIGRLGNDVSDTPSTSDAMRVAFASTASTFRACFPEYCDDNNLVEDVFVHQWVSPGDGSCVGGGCTAMAPDASSAAARTGPEPDCAAWGSAQGAGDASALLVGASKCLVRPAVPRKPLPLPPPIEDPPVPQPGDDDYEPPPPTEPPQPPDDCEPGEPPPSGEGGGDRHHIATNKSVKRPSRNAEGSKGDPWTKRFKDDVFDKAGLSMSDEANVIRVPNHKRAAHPHEYHREVYTRLTNAVEGAGQNASKARIREAVKEELRKLAEDVLDPTRDLSKWITKDNPDCPHGPVPWPF